MGIGNIGCPLCGGQHARKTRPMGTIDCSTCPRRVCSKHATWVHDAWRCTKCVRAAKRREVGR